ncbi:flagellar L-ring protein [Pseudogulbenkiania sp. NH8B]|uniref:Flagellar L-ring protein n=1 Tax=Pseudogulbenkiania ferrooxidans 2002 TaxID=279714 RepID=B9YZ49_9NEIS|nr:MULTISPECIES: flagellar basal body L-ring protein FlgH [Pseudogulbenkiania]EEG10402.1 flagellar L-ring protein [Pseudogulbenkiania ferrooxidans 2002]BAK78345.1 flagellar L-ring protein [Pseudogulbenkiania sp. NH8B]
MFRRVMGGTALACLLGACSSVSPTAVSGPTTVRPGYALANLENRNQGGIFRAGSAHLLFEQQSARYIGDIVKIEIAESLSGSNKSGTSGSRKNALKVAGPGAGSSMTGLLKWIFDIDVDASGSDSFSGKGENTNSNVLKGKLAASVINILPNGNLVVAGEKSIAQHGNSNTLRFSGVVSPNDIKAGNLVSSDNVADARFELGGRGLVADSNSRSWMQQFLVDTLSFW